MYLIIIDFTFVLMSICLIMQLKVDTSKLAREGVKDSVEKNTLDDMRWISVKGQWFRWVFQVGFGWG